MLLLGAVAQCQKSRSPYTLCMYGIVCLHTRDGDGVGSLIRNPLCMRAVAHRIAAIPAGVDKGRCGRHGGRRHVHGDGEGVGSVRDDAAELQVIHKEIHS